MAYQRVALAALVLSQYGAVKHEPRACAHAGHLTQSTAAAPIRVPPK
jgi:hypothetical protein